MRAPAPAALSRLRRPPPPRPESSIENASTSGFAITSGRDDDVKIHVSNAQSAYVTSAPEVLIPPDNSAIADEPDAEPVFDDDLPVESQPGATDVAPEPEPEPVVAAVATTTDGQPNLADELAAAQDEVEARTALWRQALADLSEAHQETEAAREHAQTLQVEHDRLQAAFAAAESERRDLAARLELLDGQHAAAEAALLAELTAARGGRPSPVADGEVQTLRQELVAAQAALRGLDDQAEAEATELRRQLTEALTENERLSAQLDAVSLPTTPLRQDAAGEDD